MNMPAIERVIPIVGQLPAAIDEMTVESLYLSPALAEELEARPAMHRRRRDEQMQLMETPPRYGKAKISKRVS